MSGFGENTIDLPSSTSDIKETYLVMNDALIRKSIEASESDMNKLKELISNENELKSSLVILNSLLEQVIKDGKKLKESELSNLQESIDDIESNPLSKSNSNALILLLMYYALVKGDNSKSQYYCDLLLENNSKYADYIFSKLEKRVNNGSEFNERKNELIKQLGFSLNK